MSTDINKFMSIKIIEYSIETILIFGGIILRKTKNYLKNALKPVLSVLFEILYAIYFLMKSGNKNRHGRWREKKWTICRNRSEFIVNFHFRLKIVDKPHEKKIIVEPESGFIVLSRVCSYLLLLQDKCSNLDHKKK